MPVRRVFIDWNRPALPGVVEHLLSRQPAGRSRDFSNLIAVFPGSEAGRRFLELLTRACDGKVSPPRIVTVGALPELLYQPQRPFASDLTQQFAWVRALREVPLETRRLIVPVPPENDDSLGWLRLGEMLARQHTELAADRLRFADVAREGAGLDGFDEAPRWTALAEVQARYLALLDRLGLWDLQTARLVAIDQQECRTDKDIIAVGAVDLNHTARAMLELVADRVTAYVHAPQSHADRFDSLGCLIPFAWEDVPVDLSAEQLLIREDPAGQCDAVVRCLSQLQGRFAVDDIVVAVPESQLIPRLRASLDAWGVPSFHPVEKSLSATGPYRVLEQAVSYLDGGRADELAALIRHPHVTAWLDRRDLPRDWLTCWDVSYCRHLPRLAELMLCDSAEDEVALQVRDRTRDLLAAFGGGLKPLAGWAASVREFFRMLYADRKFQLDAPEDQLDQRAVKQLVEGFDALAQLPAEFDPPVSAVEALRLILHELSRDELYRTEAEPAVHLAGWLEVPLDDSAVAFITSFNEGLIPSSINHDLFLPDRLRSHLGIEDSARRYARDLHALLTILNSREVVRIISARRDSRGDPLAPSRLLFASEPEQIARRVQAFYRAPAETVSWVTPRRSCAPSSGFAIPRPRPLPEPPQTIRVTAFRDFLSSPYRFYLRHIERLEEVSDDVFELAPMDFGTLVHNVLEDFGRSELRLADQPREIERFLFDRLHEFAQTRFGSRPQPAVLIQLERARLRLSGFARWQTQWRREGWEIHSVEQRDPLAVPLTLDDGRSLRLTGRIDRIDRHPATGAWAVFDYKTSESGNTPDQDHRAGPVKQKRWVNLQLPLYRRLAAARHVEGNVQLGYIVLPRDPDGVTHHLADWDQGLLAEADALALTIVRRILDQDFWTPLDAECKVMHEYDDVCLLGVSGQEVLV